MDARKYQEMAMRTNDRKGSERLASKLDQELVNKRYNLGEMLNASLGLSGEVGELNDLIKKWIFHGHPLYQEEFIKETGDIIWYICLMCDSIGVNIEDVMWQNIEKLQKRYPDGFSEQASRNRVE